MCKYSFGFSVGNFSTNFNMSRFEIWQNEKNMYSRNSRNRPMALRAALKHLTVLFIVFGAGMNVSFRHLFMSLLLRHVCCRTVRIILDGPAKNRDLFLHQTIHSGHCRVTRSAILFEYELGSWKILSQASRFLIFRDPRTRNSHNYKTASANSFYELQTGSCIFGWSSRTVGRESGWKRER